MPRGKYILANGASPSSLTTEALDPKITDTLFIRYEPLFVDICARWLMQDANTSAKIAAFGRVVPLAPHLAEHAEKFLSQFSAGDFLGPISTTLTHAESLPENELCEVLLGTFRLLSFENSTFAKYVRPLSLQNLLSQASRVIRYLAVRVFCLYLHAADAAMESLVKKYVGEEVIHGEWEGKVIDYRFLSLWEEKRYEELNSRRSRSEIEPFVVMLSPNTQLSPMTVDVHGVLLPRLGGPPSTDVPSKLVPTSTTKRNLRNIASGLLSLQPLLLTGLPGSGKTLLVRSLAWQLNKLSSMVTLHLNEQSDAKLLVGMYATGTTPGSFSWRPGVLTTAVREGRWIFIEDLDRAPTGVISTLLPLIERGELLIPSRGEIVKAARGFKIIATMSTTLSSKGEELIPRPNMIGSRFWSFVPILMPNKDEFQEVIAAKYPNLQGHVPSIMRVYTRLEMVYREVGFASDNGVSLRALTPRDLLKWCDRISALLTSASTLTSDQLDDIFMEAMDCFAGSLQSDRVRMRVMACVAEELHIDPQRRDHLLSHREIRYDVPSHSSKSGGIRIGRTRLDRHRIPGASKSGTSRPFSTNEYTLRLLEKIAVAIDRKEPLLLVGETGTGKTTCIQFLADQVGRKLMAFNLSQQSESGDLLGGYKPVNIRSLVIPMKDEFDDLFDTTFSRKKNHRFIEVLGKRMAKGEWKRVCTLWREALRMVEAACSPRESRASSEDPDGGQPKKKRKVDSLPRDFPKARWDKFATDLNDLEAQLSNGSEAFAFSFVEGNIIKAVRNGDWVLLDEINLASSDTLEALADLLGGGPEGTPSILLTETGSVERVVAHPNFRIFAAMNPATDVGKKDLPPGIRSRFTELYVESPDSDAKSLRNIVEKYLGKNSNDPTIAKIASDVTNLYMEIQKLAKKNMLVDGADQKAHFSLRTLTRTLSYASDTASLCSLRRALYEGFHMSFLTFLGRASEGLVAPLIKQHLFNKQSNINGELQKRLKRPEDSRSYVQEGHYWLRQGKFPVEDQSHYIITPFVRRNLNNLIRAASTRRYPVLIQGPTSSGKTSMIEYLAKRSGNKFVRINNHEHTDLQEYLGTYISGADGRLQFQEGILVRALREGHWIVLDELNLAPTDVLEALNRLLDDNRELLIPETQEVVRPHEDFMLFATQNPAGLYGGRKVLSRAFRNRFLELHFDDIPVDELTEILCKRTNIPESWCKRIVKVYEELSTLRQENRLFEQKSFATLRDLFRWALRKAETIRDLAQNGYMLLAERVRKLEERHAVKKVIETVMSKGGPRTHIDEELLYSADRSPEIKLYQEKFGSSSNVVWTQAMRRLFVLVAHAVRNNEPVLLVGETGCGKTTVCQMLADVFGRQLHIVNAHQNTETGDLIGAQRPIRNRAAVEDHLHAQLLSIFGTLGIHLDSSNLSLEHLIGVYDRLDQATLNIIPIGHRKEIESNRMKTTALFEWVDGSLVHAMKTGNYFLLDEISLADDSVLERLNSVLEPQRTLLLAEKGPIDSLVVGAKDFQFLATMNPGGDYGKRELSPALRNRFTEIWVPALSDLEDTLQIVRAKLKPSAVQFAGPIVSFAQWFNDKYNTSATSSISLRDTLAWVAFINKCQDDDQVFGVVHGAAMVFIDTLGANPAGLLAISPSSVDSERKECLHRLGKLIGTDTFPFYFGSVDIITSDKNLILGPFSISKYGPSAEDPSFSLEAPTTRSNAMRIIRALQLSKPILLEGNPGVGKTTLVTAIAKALGKPLARLNLSEQTDLMDLFGSDVPVEGGKAGVFTWRDAPFLRAMKNGDWVLLDEMNLASQSVLEGLNAVLDHRGEIYVSELDQTFHKHPDFRVFAAQNPHHQGGGRKGLPASFVNRFTVVYADIFRPNDLTIICKQVFPHFEVTEVDKLITFVAKLEEHVVHLRSFGVQGSPWEFNLRDTLRWLQLLTASKGLLPTGTARDFLDTIFTQRFRNVTDRDRTLHLFLDVYGDQWDRKSYHNLGPHFVQVGIGLLERNPTLTPSGCAIPLRTSQLGPMESLIICVQQNWPVILVGPPGSGKTTTIKQIAALSGANLVTFSMNADIDAMDLVGGYEQVDPARQVHAFLSRLDNFVRTCIIRSRAHDSLPYYLKLLEILNTPAIDVNSEIYSLVERISQEDPSPEALNLFEELVRLSESSRTIDGARFQWVDGLLIQALEHGQWLVLENANLCSSSVLDRLNSLLEPNGYLSINEHSTADGEAKIIKPHPNFRIFMTMDPRYGELSRAMRNRAVEIFLLPDLSEQGESQIQESRAYPLESAMYRFRYFKLLGDNYSSKSLDLIDVIFDHLAISDSSMIDSFQAEVSKGLLGYKTGQSTPTNTHQEHNKFSNPTSVNHYMSLPNRASLEPSISDDSLLTRFVRKFDGLLQFRNVWVPKASDFHAKLANLIEFEGNFAEAQAYHPLINEISVHCAEEVLELSVWVAALYEVVLDLSNMKQALDNLQSQRTERRIEKKKIPSFLANLWRVLAVWVEEAWRNGTCDKSVLNPLGRLRELFWALFALANSTAFDRATFQTYLTMIQETTSTFQNGAQPTKQLGSSVFHELSVFGSGIQLTSGLSMERLWTWLKPKVSTSSEELDTTLRFESLADRFDAILWHSEASLDELCHIRGSLSNALALLVDQNVDTEELMTSLESGIHELEQKIAEETSPVLPYFEEDFEGICQFIDILPPQEGASLHRDILLLREKSTLLSRRPTKTVMSKSGSLASGTFFQLFHYVGMGKAGGQEIAINGRFQSSILRKMNNVESVSLMQLRLFESELEILGRHLANEASSFIGCQHSVLDHHLRLLMNELFGAHKDLLSSISPIVFHKTVPANNPFRLIVENTLQPGLDYLDATSEASQSDIRVASKAWISFALAGLSLYVPDRPFDPALRPMIERQFFNDKQDMLESKLRALKEFSQEFAGQESNMRIRLIIQELQGMGLEPPVPAVARPAVSELEVLQGEFSNLLSIVQPMLNGTVAAVDVVRDHTFRQNVSHIIKRLNEGYRYYDDITDPVIGFLTCLNIGLTLTSQSYSESVLTEDISYLTDHTPFFGFSAPVLDFPAESLVENIEKALAPRQHTIDLRWHALHALAVVNTMSRNHVLRREIRELIHNIFTSFYTEWKGKLLQDQVKEAESSRLYTYRGGNEGDATDEEEDLELFPNYEKDSETEAISSNTTSSQELAVQLSDMHQEIFLGGKPASDGIKSLLHWSTSQAGSITEDDRFGTTSLKLKSTLPVVFVAIQQKSASLSSTGAGRHYNFYFDANIIEAKRYIKLINKIQHRYRQIKLSWPEHATLGDVLRTCDEALAFRHIEPVAKFLTKAEKLHGYVYEWGRVASREFSTANLYDELTALLISWRQLELSTWARLFDIEVEKCATAAKSWWFVAYETIIAASESLESSETDMKSHAKDLLRILEDFFSSTTLGQFQQRVKLLQQLREHISMRLTYAPALLSIQLALNNFISYFSRFEKPVQQAIAKGRQNLEKEVNNVIRLAGWKDTNIEALKQSAQKSHRKLSKLVRKFRAVLNQPISGVLKQGFPEEKSASASDYVSLIPSTDIHTAALTLCETYAPGWVSRPSRFKNLSATLSIMRSKSELSPQNLDGSAYLESFITNLESSMTQLQRITPSTLTEENKVAVKHLKSRKRKLFADTLKEVRQMGFRSNLGGDILQKQESLSTVISSLPAISASSTLVGRESEYYLFKTLSVMPQVREISREHSDDLTSTEVARSVGYLESMLHTAIRQRHVLVKSMGSVEDLEEPVSLLRNLWAPENYTLIRTDQAQNRDSQRLHYGINWLAAILRVGADIVDAQATLGNLDLSVVINGMREWGVHFEELFARGKALPALPQNIWTDKHTKLNILIRDNLQEVDNNINKWITEFPLVQCTLEQILPWIQHHVPIPVNVETLSPISIEDSNGRIFEALDLILGSMQDVEKSLSTLPKSTDEVDWFLQEEQTLSATINALHAPHIVSKLRSIIDSMWLLQDTTGKGSGIHIIAAIFASVLPVILQYRVSLKESLNRFSVFHTSTCKLSYCLSKAFVQIGTQGFCAPSEKTDEKIGQSDKLETGTGLGEGKGAEDISKDIEDDEDMTELAQQPDEMGDKEDIEDENDAVNMDGEEMEGEAEDKANEEDEDGSEKNGEEDLDSEVGEVDDLGPSTVDEKMWDDGGEDAEKDREGDEGKGTKKKDEQVAAKENGGEQEKGEEEDEDEMDVDEGADESENVGDNEMEKMDPHTNEGDALDLPDELNMDDNVSEAVSEDSDIMGDMEDEDINDKDIDMKEQDSAEPAEPDDVSETADDLNGTIGHVDDGEEQEEQQEDEGEPEDTVVPLPDEKPAEDSGTCDDKKSADTSAEAGAGTDAQEDAQHDQDASASAATHEDGSKGENSEQKGQSNTEEGKLGQASKPDAAGREEDAQDLEESQPFQKIGDALERWYNQQSQIRDATKKDNREVQEIEKDADMAGAEFEHLPDEQTEADAQALGTASEEQAKALDDSMALSTNEDEERITALPEDKDKDEAPNEYQDVDMEDFESDPQEKQGPEGDGRPKAFVGEHKPLASRDENMEDAEEDAEDLSDRASSVHEVETQLSLTHLDSSTTIPTPETARDLWLHHESTTHSLAQTLTEHLRLILAPTLATKLRGDFRTGKRLNLKRIIPYIASGYRRDKIWLRRSQPSKRAYQIMIALDDSRSMAESGTANLALKTLALIARALAMLEVGEVAVVCFGDDVKVAHEFDKPFTSDAGAEVFGQFSFQQQRTDVKRLVERSLELFQDARMNGQGRGEELWQLMLIVSDGICDSHEEIQRLVRMSQEQRIMIVFIVVDATAGQSLEQDSAEAEAKGIGQDTKEKQSILDLQSVDITTEGKVVRWRYMDRFPFRWYLVVRDVAELPGVLATALRQWFAEVVDAAG